MATSFKEASQVRSALKMKLSNYSWYCSSGVFFASDDYYIIINVKRIDNEIRKIIPPLIDGVNIKCELDKG